MTNSTTPDSPKCPTCHSDDPTLKKCALCGAASHRGGFKKETGEVCVDPFHTSLPTKPQSVREQLNDMFGKDKVDYAIAEAAHPSETRAGEQEGSTMITRFDEFDDDAHPFRKWWVEHGKYMMSGGGRKERIWAARGWIAREQLACGVSVTGDSLCETRSAPVQTGEGTLWCVVRRDDGDSWGISRQDTPAPFMDIAQMMDEEDAKEVVQLHNASLVQTGGGSTGPDTPEKLADEMLDDIQSNAMQLDSTGAWILNVAKARKIIIARVNRAASVQGETLSAPPYRCRCSHELIRHGVRGGFPFCLDCDCKGFEAVAPTLSDRINALPEWARQHIHDIETKCDPAGDIRTIGELRDTVGRGRENA